MFKPLLFSKHIQCISFSISIIVAGSRLVQHCITPTEGLIVETLKEAMDAVKDHELKMMVRYVGSHCSKGFGNSG